MTNAALLCMTIASATPSKPTRRQVRNRRILTGAGVLLAAWTVGFLLARVG
jgi:hypothetical protein